ncbi:unnamed protein product [Brachionus calyciflorus]|uniref:Tetraspanin n=1 Tax=Brachionus calyciflorus TaxID=104777 RepID=A0A813N5R4_9BILA|nr:unnamed protein product [Brachionus calyciflorus]
MLKYETLERYLKIQSLITIILSLCLIVTSYLFRWVNIAGLGVLEDIRQIIDILPIMSYIFIAFLSYAIICFSIGLFGIFSIYTLKKITFKINITILAFLVILNFIFMILILVLIPKLELQIKTGITTSIEQAQDRGINIFDIQVLINLQKQCVMLFDISKNYACCGAVTPEDFGELAKMNCCSKPTPEIGCVTLIINVIKNYFYNLLTIPCGFLFANFIFNFINLSLFLLEYNLEFD